MSNGECFTKYHDAVLYMSPTAPGDGGHSSTNPSTSRNPRPVFCGRWITTYSVSLYGDVSFLNTASERLNNIPAVIHNNCSMAPMSEHFFRACVSQMLSKPDELSKDAG